MSSIRLLIVDDSSAMRKVVERALRMAEVEIAQVFEAGNGNEALAVLKDHTLDLILCDINMPEMNGLEFLKRRPVDSHGKGVPVIMITSESGKADVAQALSSGRKRLHLQAFHAAAGARANCALLDTKGVRSVL